MYLGINSPTIWRRNYGEASAFVTFEGTGIVNGNAIPGQQANVTATMSDGSTILTYAWVGLPAGDPLGNGANPQDYTGYERLQVTVTTAAGPFTREIPIQSMVVNSGFRVNEGLRVNG